jgi:hypothetical protein
MCGGDSHLDRMFLMVVNKANRCILLRCAVNNHTHNAIICLLAQKDDVVHRFPITVVHLEALPQASQSAGAVWMRKKV